jgi:hypothetical protein
MMNLYKYLKVITLLFFVGVSSYSFAQSACKGFSKKNCKVAFGEYVPNPQVMESEIKAGESAEAPIIFYKQHDYKIFICTEEHLGEVNFKIKTGDGDVLFDNRDFEMTKDWDFTMTSTKRLIIEVGSTQEAGDGFTESGCAAIMVGYKYTTQKGFR